MHTAFETLSVQEKRAVGRMFHRTFRAKIADAIQQAMLMHVGKGHALSSIVVLAFHRDDPSIPAAHRAQFKDEATVHALTRHEALEFLRTFQGPNGSHPYESCAAVVENDMLETGFWCVTFAMGLASACIVSAR